MRWLVLLVAAALCASLTVTVVNAQPSYSTASVSAKKKCGKHKRHHHHHKRKPRCGSPGGGSGGGGGSGTGSNSPAPCTNTPSSPGRAAAFESEYTIGLSRASVGCGTVILEQNTMQAMDPHDLVLQKEGDSAPTYAYDQLGPGSFVRKTLNLSRGNWVLYCDLSNHRQLGMEVILRVD